MMTQQVHKKRKKLPPLSEEMQKALDELNVDFSKLRPKVDKVFEIGRLEGYSDLQIGELVRVKMSEHYSSSTIREVLPKTAKHAEMARDNPGQSNGFAPDSGANEHKTTTPESQKPPEELFDDKEMKRINKMLNATTFGGDDDDDKDEEDKDQERERMGLGTKKTEPNIIFKFKVDEFVVEELPQRNREYIIDACEHWFTQANKFKAESDKWKSKYEELLAKTKAKPTKPKEVKKQ